MNRSTDYKERGLPIDVLEKLEEFWASRYESEHGYLFKYERDKAVQRKLASLNSSQSPEKVEEKRRANYIPHKPPEAVGKER